MKQNDFEWNSHPLSYSKYISSVFLGSPNKRLGTSN